MKNIIYIFLVTAFLVGCKGSSFLTQRYTNYGHGTAKKSDNIKARKQKSDEVAKQNVKKPEDLKTENVVVTGNTETVKADSKPFVVRAVRSLVKLPAKVAQNVVPQSKELAQENSAQELDVKAELRSDVKLDKSQKTSAFKAIIGKILKIIILVLMIVLVGLIIFVLMATGAI